jgi:hypothetical protein
MKCGTNRDAFTAPRAHFERDTDRRAYESDKIRNDLVGNPSGIASDSRGIKSHRAVIIVRFGCRNRSSWMSNWCCGLEIRPNYLGSDGSSSESVSRFAVCVTQPVEISILFASKYWTVP